MPFASNGTLALHYRSTGRGPALLLVMGLGMTARGWWRTVPTLARSFRVLTFDNRGVGRSDDSPGPYTVAEMADDAVAVLDAAGEEHAHVYGISLGGMVAQEVALRHADRVRALVLGATTPGGLSAAPDLEGLAFLARAVAMSHEEALWASVPYSYGEATRRRHGQRIAEDIATRLPERSGIVAYSHQIAAAAGHATLGRLHRISAPTLVVHGKQDAIVPSDNARLIADAIPGAELELWPSAGHLYITDDPRIDDHIHRFLLRHTPERRGPAVALHRARGQVEAQLRQADLALTADRLGARLERAARTLGLVPSLPLERYSRLPAARVIRRLDVHPDDELRRLHAAESQGRNRSAILRAIEARLGDRPPPDAARRGDSPPPDEARRDDSPPPDREPPPEPDRP